jgi:hypothetical protein
MQDVALPAFRRTAPVIRRSPIGAPEAKPLRAVDPCPFDPGFEVDLAIIGSLRSMTAVWLGVSTLRQEVGAGRMELIGDVGLARDATKWLGLSVVAPALRRVA